MNRLRLFAAALLVLAASLARAEGSATVRKLLSKGINFDHIFDPYQGIGDPKLPWDPGMLKMMAANLKASEFQQVAGLGFTHVRLNLGRSFIQEAEAPYKLRPEGLALLDKAVDMALTNHLGLILDMHQVPAPKLFHDPRALDAFRALWKGLAAHYAKRSPDLLFELLNEPNVDVLSGEQAAKAEDLEKWRRIVTDLVNTIHQQDPGRYVIVSGGGWSDPKGLIQMGNLHLPRLIYTFHCYEPMVFTHQGATWTGPALAKVKQGVPYPISGAEMRKLAEGAKREKLEDWPFTQYPEGFNKASLELFLKPVLDFGKQEGLILYSGEFGVHKPFAPRESRARWIRDYVDILDKQGVAWAMWAYHSGFDLVDDKGKPDPAIVQALGLKK